MLHPGPATALADRRIEGVIAGRPEGADIAAPEPRHGVFVQQGLADRQKFYAVKLLDRSLGLRIKGPDGLQGVAKQVQTDRLLAAGRKDIDHPAADCELAPLRNGGGPLIAIDREIPLQVIDLHLGAGPGGVAGGPHPFAGRHPLDRPGHGRDQHDRLLAVHPRQQPRQGGHPLRRDGRRGPDPVIGQAVPAGKRDDLHLRGEEPHGGHKGLGPRPVPGDKTAEAAPGAGDIGHDQGVIALRRAGQDHPPVRARHGLQVRSLPLPRLHGDRPGPARRP